MSTGLLFDCDETVAQYLFVSYGWKPFKYDRAVGLISGDKLQGAVLFHCYNGSNVELSYYGQATMTAGVVRTIARFIIYTFAPSRLTVLTSKRNKHLIRSFQRLGFKLEGTQQRYYGARDCNRNTAARLVMFRERINVIARLQEPIHAQPRPSSHRLHQPEHAASGQPPAAE